jgi:predicted RNA-binding protein associated with RNAse of E/G family
MASKSFAFIRRNYLAEKIDADWLEDAVMKGLITADEKAEIMA